MGELIAAMRANNSVAFKDLLSESFQELGTAEAEELV